MSVVGIDLGTTNTVVACVRSGKVHVLADEQGVRLLPSVVGFHPNGEVLVGANAKARRVIDPRNTVYSHKRLIGRAWGSPEIAQARARFAFELREGPGQGPLVHARGQDYTLPEISAFVLKRTRQIAEQALGTPVERAVITVPAHFNELQRASTKVAGRVSGLEVLRILNEPTAAALAYGLGRSGSERVAVYDFGGGTFDCTLLDLNGNVFEVLATAGDSFLGGDDIDAMIAERMADTFLKAHRQDARQDASMYERLKTAAEDVKIALSSAESHTIILKEFGHGVGGAAQNFSFTLTRRDLEAMITPLVERTFKVTQDALALARLSPSSFDKVILVGGSTRAPLVRQRVEAFFGTKPMDRVNPDEVVAIGAAIQAAALTEGAKRRSIPAPPPVPGQARTLPGVQSDARDDTQTSEVDPSTLGTFGMKPGYGSPPSSPNPTKAGPPPTGVSGYRPPPPRAPMVTSPGVAPATQQMGARPSPQVKKSAHATDDDASVASFPDLAVPTPFEWFPSGQPSSGGEAPKGSERSFANEPPKAAPGAASAKGATAVGFGAIDEPPSLYSTPSASVPSFPSMNTGASGGMPSPIGEPEPMAEPFGQVRDLSLISSTGMSSGPTNALPGSNPEFGHVSDLSLISSSARAPSPSEGFDELETKVGKRGPESAPGLRAAPASGASDADLPAVAQRADLPAVAKRPQIQKRKEAGGTAQGGPAMLGKPPPAVAPQPFGPMERIDEENNPRTAQMPGQPPPKKPVAPQPVGARTMQSAAVQGPPSMTSAMPGAPKGPSGPNTLAMTAPVGGPNPMAQTTPLGAKTQGLGNTQALGTTTPLGQNAPPIPPAFGSSPPQPQTAQFGSFGSASPFGSAPPFAATPAAQQPPAVPAPAPVPQSPYASQPPPLQGFGMHASQPPPQPHPSQPPPQPHPSQPPGFGFQSAPPVSPSQPPLPPQGLYAEPVVPMAAPTGRPQYPGPVLVDVTPRGLVVETAGGYTDTIIPRNSKIPCERTRRFATGRDMQTTVRVRVAQGEQPYFPQNTYLGEVELSGLRPAPRGEVTVAVTFEVDADGSLRIRARDVQTGQEARATLQLVGVADESSVVMMINRFAQQNVGGGGPPQ